MKKNVTLIFLFVNTLLVAQNIFKDVDYKKDNNKEIYKFLRTNKNDLIIGFSGIKETGGFLKLYFVYSKDKIYKYEHFIDYPYNGYSYLKIIEVYDLLKPPYKDLLIDIINKKYLQNIKQEDLDIKPHEHDYLMYSHCGTAYIEFYQGNKSYKLEAECTKYDKGRNKESLALFNELYKLLNNTWNIQNGVQGRFIENKENN